MELLFGFRQQRSVTQAIIFYLAHLAVVILLGAVLGVAFSNSFGGGVTVGKIVAILYCSALCVFVVKQRQMAPKYYGSLVIVIPAAAILRGLLGLLVPGGTKPIQESCARLRRRG